MDDEALNESHSATECTLPDDATEVRFGIRSMLILMTVVAVVVTALGAFIRSFPADAQLPLTIYWGILAVLLVAIFAYSARKRYLAESKAGRVLYRLVPHNYYLPRMPTFASGFAGTMCLLAAPAVWVGYSFAIAEPSGAGWWQALNFNTIYALIAAGAGISHFWWRRIILAENGLIVRNAYVPWTDCRRWYWDACNKHVAVIVSDRRSQIAVKAPPEDREAIITLLAEKTLRTLRSTGR